MKWIYVQLKRAAAPPPAATPSPMLVHVFMIFAVGILNAIVHYDLPFCQHCTHYSSAICAMLDNVQFLICWLIVDILFCRSTWFELDKVK